MTIISACPRCNQSFECNKQDIKQCFCRLVELTEQQQKQLSQQYQGCLCKKCLESIIVEYSF